MARRLIVLALASSWALAPALPGGPTDDELNKKPVTTLKGDLGALLRDWHKLGTAAGNAGDWYDNRDGDHSPRDLGPEVARTAFPVLLPPGRMAVWTSPGSGNQREDYAATQLPEMRAPDRCRSPGLSWLWSRHDKWGHTTGGFRGKAAHPPGGQWLAPAQDAA